MASIDELSAAIDSGIDKVGELSGVVAEAARQAQKLAERLGGMNADGMAKALRGVAAQLEWPRAQLGLAASKLENARATADSVRQV